MESSWNSRKSCNQIVINLQEIKRGNITYSHGGTYLKALKKDPWWRRCVPLQKRKGGYQKMVQQQSILKVADNTGAREIMFCNNWLQ